MFIFKFHPELCLKTSLSLPNDEDSKTYEYFLKKRPQQMENEAVKLITDLALKYKRYILTILSKEMFKNYMLTACTSIYTI